MTLTPAQTSQALELLEHSELLEENGKQLFRNVLNSGEVLDEESLEALSIWIDSENAYLTAREAELEQKIQEEERKSKEAENKLFSDSEKIEADLKRMFQDEVDKAISKMNTIDKKAGAAQEKLIHENVEEAQIDSLHDFLKTPKKEEETEE